MRERLERCAGHVRDEELHAVLWPAVRAELRRELERHARMPLVRTHAGGRSHTSVRGAPMNEMAYIRRTAA